MKVNNKSKSATNNKLKIHHRQTINIKCIYRINIVLFSFIILFSFFQFLDYSFVNPIIITKNDNENLVKWNLDELIVSEKFVTVMGWALILDEEISSFDISIILENNETKKAIEMPTILLENETINNVYPGEIDYANSGFYAKVNNRFLDLDNNSYNVYIKYFNNGRRIFVKTNIVIFDKYQNDEIK